MRYTHNAPVLADECRCEQCRAEPRNLSKPLSLPQGAMERAFPVQPASPETESQIDNALVRLRALVG